MKESRLYIRVTDIEKSLIKERARRYTEGSISRYIMYCIENANLKKTPTKKAGAK